MTNCIGIKRAIKLSHGQPSLKNFGPLQPPHFEKPGYTSALSQGKLVQSLNDILLSGVARGHTIHDPKPLERGAQH